MCSLKTVALKVTGFIIGAIIGLVVVLLAYQLLHLIAELTDSGYVKFRAPVAFFILPIMSGVIGWMVSDTLDYKGIYQKIKNIKLPSFWKAGPLLRAVVIFPLVWLVTVLLYVLLFSPFGHVISSREWSLVVKIVLFPSFLVGTVYFLYIKVIKRPEK